MNKIKIILVMILLYCVVTLIYAGILYCLWNWLVVDIFGLKALSFIKALGVTFLLSFLTLRINVVKE